MDRTFGADRAAAGAVPDRGGDAAACFGSPDPTVLWSCGGVPADRDRGADPADTCAHTERTCLCRTCYRGHRSCQQRATPIRPPVAPVGRLDAAAPTGGSLRAETGHACAFRTASLRAMRRGLCDHAVIARGLRHVP